jgi:hypothetical protein
MPLAARIGTSAYPDTPEMQQNQIDIFGTHEGLSMADIHSASHQNVKNIVDYPLI